MNKFCWTLVAAMTVLAGMPALSAESPPGSATSARSRPALQGLPDVDSRMDKMEFKDTRMVDVMRTLSEMTSANIVVTEEAGKKVVTVFLKNISVREAIETISKNAGLWYRMEKDGRTFRIMTTQEYQGDMVVYREDETRVFNLLHPNPTEVATAISDIYGTRVLLPTLCDSGEVRRLGGSATGAQAGGGRTGSASRTPRRMGGAGSIGSAANRNRLTGAGGVTIRGGAVSQSELLVDEEMTPDQLARLESSIGTDGSGTVSSEDLSRITRNEPPIYLSVNCEHNLIILRTSDTAAIKDIEALILKMDRPVPQVLLEMKIIELSSGDSFEQLFELNYQTGGVEKGPGVWLAEPSRGQPASTTVVPAVPGIAGTATTTVTDFVRDANGNVISQSTTTTPGQPNVPGVSASIKEVAAVAADAGYTASFFNRHNLTTGAGSLIYQFLNDRISARIKLLQSENRVKTLSSPILLASNNRKSELFMGTESLITKGWNPGSTVVNNGQTTVVAPYPALEPEDVGPKLTITPKINADKTVTLEIDQAVTSIIRNLSQVFVADATGQVTPRFVDGLNKSTINGIVTAKDGLTVAIGGLIREGESKVESKVPVLGDIPLLGELFTSRNNQKSQTEMILLITPHIITDPSQAEKVTRDAVEPISAQEW